MVVASRAERWSRIHSAAMTPILSVVADELDEMDEIVSDIRNELKAIRKEMSDGHQANRRLLWGILLAVLAAALTLAASAASILISAGGGT
jgi:hypothetical protein